MMGSTYYYFCSQLPTLMPGTAAPMSLADFDALLKFLPERDAVYIASCTFPPDRNAAFPAGSAADEFRQFELALRGEIARLRLEKRPAEDAVRYSLPPETGLVSGVRDAVAHAASAPDPWERERRIDEMRWKMLDAMERVKPFSREAAACYRLKLAILARNQRFRTDAGKKNFETAVGEIDRRSAE